MWWCPLLVHIVLYWTVAWLLDNHNGYGWAPSTIRRVLCNQLVVNPALLWCGHHTLIRAAAPSWTHWYLVWQIPAAVLVETTLFYWIHRALHHPCVYRYIHRVHHRWKADVRPVSAIDAHPVEHAVLNLGPLLWTGWVVGLPWWWLQLWVHVSTIYALLAHCPESEHAQQHHAWPVTRFGIGTMWDRWMGTL